ncbi:MAG: hypothetical protein ABF242_07410 [Flavobacteriales bacterium]
MSKIGKIIIVSTFLVSAITFYWVLFLIPIFLIGVLLVVFSKRTKTLSKVLWSVLPIILWYPVLFLFLFIFGSVGKATAQKIDFIFKEGKIFDKIELIDNMPCGQEIIIENGRQQVYIEPNIMTLYQGNFEYGYINHDYYFIRENGEKIKGVNKGFDVIFEMDSDFINENISVRFHGMSTTKLNSDIKYHSQTIFITNQNYTIKNTLSSFAMRDTTKLIIEECLNN